MQIKCVKSIDLATPSKEVKKTAVPHVPPQSVASPAPGPSGGGEQQFRQKVINYRDETKKVIDYPSKRYPGRSSRILL